MTQLVFRQRIGLGAAFIAVYALVFNVILSSILVASLSSISLAAAHEICIGGVSRDAAPTDADKNGQKVSIHCPLCVAHHVAGGLPPLDTTLVERVLLRAEAIYSFQERVFARARSFAHLTRGPPDLI